MTLDPNSQPCRIPGVQLHSLADGRLLIRHPRGRGVRILDRRVVSASIDAGGAVDALIDAAGGRHVHDFYLDCSGFRALLISEVWAFRRSIFRTI